jgi:hypothetical protein
MAEEILQHTPTQSSICSGSFTKIRLQEKAQTYTIEERAIQEKNRRINLKHRAKRTSICRTCEKNGISMMVGRRVQESAVAGVSQSGDHGRDGCGGEDALRHPKGHATPCPRAPHYELHPLVLGRRMQSLGVLEKLASGRCEIF